MNPQRYQKYINNVLGLTEQYRFGNRNEAFHFLCEKFPNGFDMHRETVMILAGYFSGERHLRLRTIACLLRRLVHAELDVWRAKNAGMKPPRPEMGQVVSFVSGGSFPEEMSGEMGTWPDDGSSDVELPDIAKLLATPRPKPMSTTVGLLWTVTVFSLVAIAGVLLNYLH